MGCRCYINSIDNNPTHFIITIFHVPGTDLVSWFKKGRGKVGMCLKIQMSSKYGDKTVGWFLLEVLLLGP